MIQVQYGWNEDADGVILSRKVVDQLGEHPKYVAVNIQDAWVIVQVSAELASTSTCNLGILGAGGPQWSLLTRVIQPVPLEMVILSVVSIAQSATFEYAMDKGMVVRQGDELVADFGGYAHVVQAEPSRQGVLTPDTRIVLFESVAELEDGMQEEEEEEEPEEDIQMNGDEIDFTEFKHGMRRVVCTTAALERPKDDFMVQPRPISSEDSEARVYVSVQTLARLGCFAGDSVLVSALDAAQRQQKRNLHVYVHEEHHNRALLPPILLYNLGCPAALSIIYDPEHTAPLQIASKVTLSRVASPVSTERVMQDALVAGLKRFFEHHSRVVIKGDLVAVPINEALAPAFDSDTIMTTRPTAVAWYAVIEIEVGSAQDELMAVIVKPSVTRMVQTGETTQQRIPSASLPWQSYFNLDLLSCPVPLPTTSIFPSITSYITTSIESKHYNYTLPPCSILLHGKRGVGKMTALSWICASLGVHFFPINCYDILGDTSSRTETSLRARWERAQACAPCVIVLNHLNAIAHSKEEASTAHDYSIRFVLAELIASSPVDLVVVGVASDRDKLDDGAASVFRYELPMNVPDEGERLDILKRLLQDVQLAPDVNLANVAQRTAALVPCDLVDLVDRFHCAVADSVDVLLDRHPHLTRESVILSGVTFTAAHFESAIMQVRNNFSDSVGAPKVGLPCLSYACTNCQIPNVGWEDVGGLSSVKQDIMDTIQLPLDHPELFAAGLKKRSGILLYGPPGTGKTLLAKAVATSFSLNFFSVKGPELLNMYIGESEANVRRVFQKARDARPCVVFFDELDSVAPKRGNQGDSGGVMDRIVSQLLAELDGMGSGEGVFVIGATNRPDLLDPALLRPGRFDKMLYLGISNTHDQQLHILKALVRKIDLADDVDLAAIVESCPTIFTGADFYALVSDAQLYAMTRVAQRVDALVKQSDPPVSTAYYFDKIATPADTLVQVTQADFERARQGVQGSVSSAEMQHYNSVRDEFDGRTDPAKGKGKA